MALYIHKSVCRRTDIGYKHNIDIMVLYTIGIGNLRVFYRQTIPIFSLPIGKKHCCKFVLNVVKNISYAPRTI